MPPQTAARATVSVSTDRKKIILMPGHYKSPPERETGRNGIFESGYCVHG